MKEPTPTKTADLQLDWFMFVYIFTYIHIYTYINTYAYVIYICHVCHVYLSFYIKFVIHNN